MPAFICTTCGTQFGETGAPPPLCPICTDERQYVNPDGQGWTTHEELGGRHHNTITPLEAGLLQVKTEPQFGLGQRALLVQTPRGNVLWECLSLIDEKTVAALEALGGISALSSSHPHMFGSMVEWSYAFREAPIYLHKDFEKWVGRPDRLIEFWEGESLALEEGVTLYRCGGHFRGSSVLLWPEGAEGAGALLSGDTLFVTPDRRHVGFMYSYPNFIPLPVSAVDRIVETVRPLKFDRIYSSFHQREIETDGKGAVERSAVRYKTILSKEMMRPASFL